MLRGNYRSESDDPLQLIPPSSSSLFPGIATKWPVPKMLGNCSSPMNGLKGLKCLVRPKLHAPRMVAGIGSQGGPDVRCGGWAQSTFPGRRAELDSGRRGSCARWPTGPGSSQPGRAAGFALRIRPCVSRNGRDPDAACTGQFRSEIWLGAPFGSGATPITCRASA